ncbi:hypothetical protein E2320_003713 [Naja naja]|nr:hypothetical protein E2320_003713 [Naja naja]
MEIIPWMTEHGWEKTPSSSSFRAASHLLHPIREEEEEDGRDESLAQPETISPSLNSTFPLSLFQSCQASSWEQDQSNLTITNEGLNENTFNLRTADLNSDLIKCTCRFERAGGWPTSPHSNQMVFRVHEKYWAESFIFYCKDQSDLIITYENITKNTFKLRTADLNSDQMKIKCTCWFWYPHGGSPPSPQSNQLDFFINAPPSPGLRVDPLSQRVEEGDPLVFLCSTERGDREKKFHFYKDGVEITSSEEGLLEPSCEPTDPLQNASLRIPHASFNHNGEFACSYEENRSNRWITSFFSLGLNITVEPDSDPIWGYYRVAITIMILLVPFSFYCWRKKSNGYRYFQFSLGTREARRMRAVLCCREKGFGVVKKAGEPSSVLGWVGCGCDVLVGGLTQEKLQFFVCLGKEEESDRSQDQLPRNPEEKMETIPWMTGKRPSCFPSLSLQNKHRLGLLQPLKEGEGPMKPEAQREIQKEKGPSLWITLKFLLFMSLVNLRWTLLETSSSSNIKWRRGVESGSPEGSHTIRFFFICKDQSYSPVKDEHHSNNTFNVRTENVSSDQIRCKCKFTFRKFKETSWGQPYSPESNQLVFSVVGVPTSPMLKVDPLSQRVEEGDPLVFLCSTEGGTTEKKFHFYKDGMEITSSKGLLEPSTDHLQNASLRIRHASFNDRGEFACSYEEKRSNRWIMSSLSQGRNITVEPVCIQGSDPIWRYFRVTITIIILLVLFAFYCWTKKSVKKKERGDLGMMEPPAATAATASPVKDSEATYSNIQDSFTLFSPGATRENRFTQEKTGGDIGGQEDAGSSLLQRESLWCGEEGRGAELCPGLGGAWV